MSGPLLTDREIAAAIEEGHLKVAGLRQNRRSKISMDKDSRVQPSSLDLRVGLIFVPPTIEVDLSNAPASNPIGVKGFQMASGMTVVVETLEEISLDSTIAAFGFPPAHLTRNAILMTNPGHVDPGYSGKLSFTLINMGRRSFSINQGDDIVTLLIFKFDRSVEADYAARRRGHLLPPDYRGVLNALAPDFANYTERMGAAAKKAVELELHNLTLAKLWIPAIAGAIATALTLGVVASYDKFMLQPDLASLKIEIERIRAAGDVLNLDDRLDAMQSKIDTLSSTKPSEAGGKAVQ